MDILAEINEIANEYVGDVNLKLDDTFDSLDFDSLDVVQIAMAVEKKYGIKFPDKIEAKTVGDLVKMVEELTPFFSASSRPLPTKSREYACRLCARSLKKSGKRAERLYLPPPSLPRSRKCLYTALRQGTSVTQPS